jgi:hypothetical protein
MLASIDGSSGEIGWLRGITRPTPSSFTNLRSACTVRQSS